MVSRIVIPSSRGEPRDLLPHVGAHLGVEPRGGLVEEQHLRAVDEAERDVQPARHAARVRAREAVGGVGEPEPGEQLVGPGARRRVPAP